MTRSVMVMRPDHMKCVRSSTFPPVGNRRPEPIEKFKKEFAVS